MRHQNPPQYNTPNSQDGDNDREGPPQGLDSNGSQYNNPENSDYQQQARETQQAHYTQQTQQPQYNQQVQNTQQHEYAQQPQFTQQNQNNQQPYQQAAPEKSQSGRNPLTMILLAPFRLIWFILKLPLKLYQVARYVFFVGCVMPLALALAMLVLIVWQPPLIWEPTKDLINSSYELEDYTEISSTFETTDSTETADGSETNDINSTVAQINALNSGESITLTESEFSQLLARNSELENQRVDLDEDRLSLLVNVDLDNPDPLWLQLNFTIDNVAELTSARLGILPLPFNFLARLVPEDLTAIGERFDLSETDNLGSYYLEASGVTTEIINVDIADEEIVLTAK